ncbi:hypothetical protein CORAM0001_1776 [Corynebacterium amycolatum SK46]|nr:hypothetical protein CORAM0001_1776 [Corynebacterium amycolatum SK46]
MNTDGTGRAIIPRRDGEQRLRGMVVIGGDVVLLRLVPQLVM